MPSPEKPRPVNKHDPSPSEPTLVDSMLDHPAEQIAHFAGRVLGTWARGLFDPWRLGQTIAQRSRGLAPPFAYLIVNFFAAGVILRFLIAIESLGPASRESLSSTLQYALGELTLVRLTLVTLPCLLIISLGGRLLSLAMREGRSFRSSRIVRAACYAAGWQAGLITLVGFGLIVLEQLGFEPSGSGNRKTEQSLLLVTLLGIVWGTLQTLPSLLQTTTTHSGASLFRLPAAFIASSLIGTSSITLALWGLGTSIDLRTAADIRSARLHDADIGPLHTTVLKHRQLDPTTWKLTLACTNRTDYLLVLPRFEQLNPTSIAPELAVHTLGQLRVLSSSIEQLDDRALIIAAGDTRTFELTVAAPTGDNNNQPTMKPIAGNPPYALAFHLREKDGFVKSESRVYVPRELFERDSLAAKPAANIDSQRR